MITEGRVRLLPATHREELGLSASALLKLSRHRPVIGPALLRSAHRSPGDENGSHLCERALKEAILNDVPAAPCGLRIWLLVGQYIQGSVEDQQSE